MLAPTTHYAFLEHNRGWQRTQIADIKRQVIYMMAKQTVTAGKVAGKDDRPGRHLFI